MFSRTRRAERRWWPITSSYSARGITSPRATTSNNRISAHSHAPPLQIPLHRRHPMSQAPVVEVHEPLAVELQPDKVLQDRFDQGAHVGTLARGTFSGGVL